MKCPLDSTDLVMSERQGVEIDYCPTCRGVWLDRGELDKIIDRAAEVTAASSAPAGAAALPTPGPAAPAGQPPVPPAPTYAPSPAYPPTPSPGPRGAGYGDERYRDDRRDDRYRDERYRDDRSREGRDQYGRPYRKKKESWLGELFDF